MATNLEIANQALAELGSAPIDQSDFDNPVSASARVISSVFLPTLREVLSRYDFPILRGTVVFSTSVDANLYKSYPEGAYLYLQPEAADTTFDSDQWDYVFDLSLVTDFSFLRKLTTPEGFAVTEYALEGTHLLTNNNNLFVHYTKKITDASVLPEYIIPAITYKLAARIAKPLTGEVNEREMMNREFEKAFSRARRRASHEKAPIFRSPDSTMGFISAHNPDLG